METTKQTEKGYKYEQAVKPENLLMTQADIEATTAKWNSIGAVGSRERLCAFAILTMTHAITQASIGNQLPVYEVARLEQLRFELMAVRDTYKIGNRMIEACLNRLKEVGLLDKGYWIPDLTALEQKAVRMINQRGKVAE